MTTTTTILNMVSVTSAFVFGTGIIYVILDTTIGRLKHLHSKRVWRGLQVKDFVFLALGVFVVLNYTSFVRPY